jgi:3-hydroxyacyl-CoA dehydrogenase
LQTRLEFIKVMRLGGDIAAWCAFLGLRVTLADMKPEPIASALKRAAGLYQNVSPKSIEARRHAPSPRRLHENMIAPN